jgi:hypothetical protein
MLDQKEENLKELEEKENQGDSMFKNRDCSIFNIKYNKY